LAARPVYLTECATEDGQPVPTDDLVLLNWSGGVSPLYPDTPIDGLDLSAFPTAGGGTLADREAEFKDAVRSAATRAYCTSDAAKVRIEHDGFAHRGPAAVVHLGQVPSMGGAGQIGEGEYDPCNRFHDDAAIIFGEQIRRLGGPYTFDEWVTMFANVTAHEIGHMLGYGHVERSDEATRSLYVELMLAGHTISELQREQRFVVSQDNCTKNATAARCINAPVP
jgi:hypothetical protein